MKRTATQAILRTVALLGVLCAFSLASGFTAGVLSAADAPKTPTVGVSTRIALSACESKLQELQTSFQQAKNAEQQILAEWSTANPGWHLNPVSFAPEPDAKPAPAAAAASNKDSPAAPTPKK